jgi:hypothetical protein
VTEADWIDDDIVYIADNAIPDLVAYKTSHPEHLFVSANIVNHPRLQKVQSAYAAPVPFAPEQSPIHETTDWRISTLPSSPLEEVKSMSEWPEPPDFKHRWLPMRSATIDDCPMRKGLNCSDKPQWQCAAIAHYSLLYHIEQSIPSPLSALTIDTEAVYNFGVWDLHGLEYDRWSVNFFVAWGREIISARPFPEDDEQHLSADYPKSIRKRTFLLMVEC